MWLDYMPRKLRRPDREGRSRTTLLVLAPSLVASLFLGAALRLDPTILIAPFMPGNRGSRFWISFWQMIWIHARNLGDSLLLLGALAFIPTLVALLDFLLHRNRGIFAGAIAVLMVLVAIPITLLGIVFLILDLTGFVR